MSSVNNFDGIRAQYATDLSLRIREETHEQYTIPKTNFVEWVLNRITWRGDEWVLDVGSGPGKYASALHEMSPDIQYWGVDYLPGMLKNHPTRQRVSVANAQDLPFADHTFDVVMANHMLYYVDDIERAISELKRTLKPDGVLMVVTNSVNTMRELQIHMRRAIVLLTPSGGAKIPAPTTESDLFNLENGLCQLSRHFYSVVRYDLPSALVFPSIQPVMSFLESVRSLREPQLPENVLWDDVMMIMQQQFTHLFNHWGKLIIDKLTGVLIASDLGGTTRDFVERRDATHSNSS